MTAASLGAEAAAALASAAELLFRRRGYGAVGIAIDLGRVAELIRLQSARIAELERAALTPAAGVPVAWGRLRDDGKLGGLGLHRDDDAGLSVPLGIIAAPPPADAVRALDEMIDAAAKAGTAGTTARERAEWVRFDNAEKVVRAALSAAPAGKGKPCVICGEDEPYSGACGSNDPRALCKQPAAAPTPEVGRRHDPRVEDAARALYDAMPYDGPGVKPAWVPHGNSVKQDEARDRAREQLAQQEGGR